MSKTSCCRETLCAFRPRLSLQLCPCNSYRLNPCLKAFDPSVWASNTFARSNPSNTCPRLQVRKSTKGGCGGRLFLLKRALSCCEAIPATLPAMIDSSTILLLKIEVPTIPARVVVLDTRSVWVEFVRIATQAPIHG